MSKGSDQGDGRGCAVSSRPGKDQRGRFLGPCPRSALVVGGPSVGPTRTPLGQLPESNTRGPSELFREPQDFKSPGAPGMSVPAGPALCPGLWQGFLPQLGGAVTEPLLLGPP